MALLGCIECMRYRLLLQMSAVSVCQSVCHAAQRSFTAQNRLFMVNTPGGPRNIVLDGGPLVVVFVVDVLTCSLHRFDRDGAGKG